MSVFCTNTRIMFTQSIVRIHQHAQSLIAVSLYEHQVISKSHTCFPQTLGVYSSVRAMELSCFDLD